MCGEARCTVNSFDAGPVYPNMLCGEARFQHGEAQADPCQNDLPRWLWINTYENTIFRGMNIHKSQLFWCELQGDRVLTHPQIFQELSKLSKSAEWLLNLLICARMAMLNSDDSTAGGFQAQYMYHDGLESCGTMRLCWQLRVQKWRVFGSFSFLCHRSVVLLEQGGARYSWFKRFQMVSMWFFHIFYISSIIHHIHRWILTYARCVSSGK